MNARHVLAGFARQRARTEERPAPALPVPPVAAMAIVVPPFVNPPLVVADFDVDVRRVRQPVRSRIIRHVFLPRRSGAGRFDATLR